MKSLIAALLLSFSMLASATTVTADTEYVVEQYYSNFVPVRTQVDIIGVYGAKIESAMGVDYLPIHVNITGSNTKLFNLVLSSYEKVNWVLTGNVDAVRSVLLNGFNDSTIEGLPSESIVIDRMNDNYFAACAFNWPENGNGCYTNDLVRGVESVYMTKINSFTGTYFGDKFEVNFSQVSAVPEPTTSMLTLIGLCGIISMYRKNVTRKV